MDGEIRMKNYCSICHEKMLSSSFRYGNNAHPVNNGRCCDICNTTVVIPARIKQLRDEE